MSNSFVVNGFPAWSTSNELQIVKRVRPKHKLAVYWFPILTSIFTISSFIAGYVIGVLNNDEASWFSYISDGGAVVPESCIFGILLNFGGFFWILTAAAKNIHLSQFMSFHNLNGCGWAFARWLLLLLAMASAVGLTVVANFQETSVPLAHGLGAWLAFFCGLFYVWTYIILTIVIKPKIAPTCLTLFRGLLALVTTLSLVIHMTTTNSPIFVKEDSNGKKPPRPKFPNHAPLKLDPSDPWFVNHLVATISEWVLGICFLVVILTFAYELGNFTINALSTEQLAETTEDPELKNIKPLK
ncbi:DNA damage-regulated autophagy modulator protein 1 [Aphelenchoides bicaudatus]|nr:DNA damage-regulated autophagy modulator protein 1 [Aphelenchoides bicaudatus]